MQIIFSVITISLIEMSSFLGLLHGHLLGIADEDGNVKLIDSRKPKALSVVKGRIFVSLSHLFGTSC